jgi:hypothetical protein
VKLVRETFQNSEPQQKNRAITTQVERAEEAWFERSRRAQIGLVMLQFMTYIPRWMVSIAQTIWRPGDSG